MNLKNFQLWLFALTCSTLAWAATGCTLVNDPQALNASTTAHKTHHTQRNYSKAMARHQEVFVTEPSFTPISSTAGVWKGKIQGAGKIHLHLQIHRNGALESVRYMGNISLKDKPSSFSIRSSLPPGNDWSWKLVAYRVS